MYVGLRETRKKLFEKYQKGIITSEELRILDEIDREVLGIHQDMMKIQNNKANKT